MAARPTPPDLFADAHRKIVQAREQGGVLREAIIRGHGCCSINDPEFDQALWDEALRTQEALSRLTTVAHDARWSDEHLGNLLRSYVGRGE